MDNTWTKLRDIAEINAKWLTLFCEEYRKPSGDTCVYWRVERADSLIVVPLFNNDVLLPAPDYRPGIEKTTLDLPGGRVTDVSTTGLAEAATQLVSRELGVPVDAVSDVKLVDGSGTYVNSSLSNQRLYVAQARLRDIDPSRGAILQHPIQDLDHLVAQLECLQCAYALTRFQRTL
ncbi:hypothetical protein [Thiohalocapsa halophila]|uniref:hypothetical protein n=1 Tax=Thiohalocapsa halophila TaxID=69359 RepID=UPI001907966C|nr:hypothetical protein [Thiohalocapsa halophila]